MELQISVDELRKRKVFVGCPMYGGQCTGLFMKACLDLQSVFSAHGIECRFSFIFNESLITRARNYIADEFMRSDYTHLLFIDSDINYDPRDIIVMLAMDRDIVGGAYPKKCLDASSIIKTEQGDKTIQQIVDDEYRGCVLTIDNYGNEVWRKVINHFSEPNQNKKWIEIRSSKRNWEKPLTVTDDHKLACIEDIMNPVISWIPAKYTKGKQIVERISQIPMNRKTALFNQEQLSAAFGIALGDGHIDKSGCMGVGTHGPKQKDYQQYKEELFGGSNFTNAQTKQMRAMLYPKGKKKLGNVLSYLNEISLAFMYMDDGNLRKAYRVPGSKRPDGYTSTIATHCFSVQEQKQFLTLLNNKWGIKGTLHSQGHGKYHQVFFDQINTRKFLDIIAPYIHSSMDYKLDPIAKNITKRNLNKTSLGYSSRKVISIKYKNNDSKLYDIEVEGTHCFFADNRLVHNSIKWWAIKEAILKNPEIKPEEIERLVGDFVFNAVGGTEKFNIGDPIEVLEIGTGYMMIRRDVFDKVAAGYPFIRYKPDHAGQQFFDGSRYINAYFDCYIDRAHGPDCKWDCAETHNSSERYLSEDYAFCQRARKVGCKVWLCPWMKTIHIGTYPFIGDLEAHAKHLGKL